MPKSWLILLVLAGSAAPSLAEDLLAQGRQVYMQGGKAQGATACVGCHLENGAGESKAPFPRLAGMNAEYLGKQLHDYREGRRDNPTVLPIVAALTEAEIKAVSAYIATLSSPSTVVPPPTEVDRKLLEAGRQLAEQGNWDRDIPACNACHGPGGKGVGPHFPPLAAQHPRYLIAQISAWKFGSRRNDPNDLMKAVADRLNDDEIRAVSAYYGSLNP